MKIVKRCPECGRPLVERVNRQNNTTFLGCSNYPECRHTEPIPESVLLRLAGQPGLFDDQEGDDDA